MGFRVSGIGFLGFRSFVGLGFIRLYPKPQKWMKIVGLHPTEAEIPQILWGPFSGSYGLWVSGSGTAKTCREEPKARQSYGRQSSFCNSYQVAFRFGQDRKIAAFTCWLLRPGCTSRRQLRHRATPRSPPCDPGHLLSLL